MKLEQTEKMLFLGKNLNINLKMVTSYIIKHLRTIYIILWLHHTNNDQT